MYLLTNMLLNFGYLLTIVLLFTNGFAQIPMQKMKISPTKFKHIAILNDKRSLIKPIITCKIAPPIIPLIKIPANEPWCSLREFKAKEIIMGYITRHEKSHTLENCITKY